MSAWLFLLRREIAFAWAGGGGASAPAAFFLAACALAAFGVGSAPDLLEAAAPGALVLALAFVAILGLEHLFQGDLESGALDVVALGPAPVEAVALAKILARSAATLAPIALLAPAACALLSLPMGASVTTGAAILLAAPGLVAAGAAPAALAAGRARGGLLIAVMTPPLLAPIVIFAAAAIRAAALGDSAEPALLLLGACSLGALVIGVLGAAAALRLHLE